MNKAKSIDDHGKELKLETLWSVVF
jgi:hypothetical protein